MSNSTKAFCRCTIILDPEAGVNSKKILLEQLRKTFPNRVLARGEHGIRFSEEFPEAISTAGRECYYSTDKSYFVQIGDNEIHLQGETSFESWKLFQNYLKIVVKDCQLASNEDKCVQDFRLWFSTPFSIDLTNEDAPSLYDLFPILPAPPASLRSNSENHVNGAEVQSKGSLGHFTKQKIELHYVFQNQTHVDLRLILGRTKGSLDVMSSCNYPANNLLELAQLSKASTAFKEIAQEVFESSVIDVGKQWLKKKKSYSWACSI